jgi:hypothetical protein
MQNMRPSSYCVNSEKVTVRQDNEYYTADRPEWPIPSETCRNWSRGEEMRSQSKWRWRIQQDYSESEDRNDGNGLMWRNVNDKWGGNEMNSYCRPMNMSVARFRLLLRCLSPPKGAPVALFWIPMCGRSIFDFWTIVDWVEPIVTFRYAIWTDSDGHIQRIPLENWCQPISYQRFGTWTSSIKRFKCVNASKSVNRSGVVVIKSIVFNELHWQLPSHSLLELFNHNSAQIRVQWELGANSSSLLTPKQKICTIWRYRSINSGFGQTAETLNSC